jgi:hypothetical protein
MKTLSRSARRLFKLALLPPAVWMICCLAQSHPNIAMARQERQASCVQGDDEKRMLDAITRGDSKQVEALLAAGVSPDGRIIVGRYGFVIIKVCPSSFLMPALRLDRTEIIKLLLKASHARDTDRNYSAGLRKERFVIEMLMAAGGDVNTKAENGMTPLMLAAQAGRVDLVRFLLEKGAQIDARNSPQQTALIAAADRMGFGNASIEEPIQTDMDE